MRLFFRVVIFFALPLLATAFAAEDQPDLASLPRLTAPGALSADQMRHQAAWLEVSQTGLYRLTL